MSWDVKDKVCLITGANTGIGRVTAVELAKAGAHVVLAGRSLERTQPVLDEIRAAGGRAEFIPLDLGSFASVRACAESFLEKNLPLHLLIANAGLAGFRGLTTDGFEVHFGTNHLGHFLLTCLLRERLIASQPARVILVASRAHYDPKRLDFDAVRSSTASVTGVHEYGVSKLANVLFAAELGRRLRGTGVTTYSLHPGVVASDVWRQVPWPLRSLMKLAMISNEDGAKTTLHCAVAPALTNETGLYYDKCAPKRPSRLAQDEKLADELWRRSETYCGCSFG
jgi:retinol dehydrogenase-12